MARPGSIALGGYYKTPTHLIPRIACLLEPHQADSGEVVFMDPCAGEGEAVLSLMRALVKDIEDSSLYVCEMEATRAEKLKEAAKAVAWRLAQEHVHGDAFRLTFNRKDKDGVSVLFLNPPYDLDRVYGRLEHKFLSRFTSALTDGGVLLFLVPFYALKASGEFLAKEYTDVRCFKFPDADFEAFKQVVLFARKCETRFEPDQTIVQQVEAWAQDASKLPELPNIVSKPVCQIPVARHMGLSEWVIRPVDVTDITKKIRPWVQTTRSGGVTPVHGVLPDLPIQELLLRKYPVATPPRPAHIAAGIASGIFNGSRVKPSDPKTGLPALLVKGVFDKEYRTVEEKMNKDGEVKGLVQVQQPKLVVTVLDLKTHKYHTLKSGDSTDEPGIEGLTVTGLLRHYGDSLMAVMEQQCPILYDPRKDGDSIPLAPTHRRLFTAQGHAAKAIVKLMGGPTATKKERHRKAAILLGEIGSGKSTVALVVANTVGSKRPLILCPPHLLTSWRNEITACLPEAEVRVLDSVAALEELNKDTSDKLIVSVVSRETAKLSHGWEGVGAVCPKCGGLTPAEDLAKKRSRCENKSLQGSGPIAQAVLKLANQLMRYAPNDTTVSYLLKGRFDHTRRTFYTKKHENQPLNFPGFAKSYFDSILPELLELCAQDFDRISKAITWVLLCLGDNDRILQTAKRFLDNESYRDREFGRHLLLMLPPNDPRQLAAVAEYKATDTSTWGPWQHFPKMVEDAQKGESYVSVGSLRVSWEGRTLALMDGEKARSLQAALSALKILAHVSNLKWSKSCDEFLFQATPEPRRVALAQHILRHYPNTFDFLVLDECFVAGTRISGKPIEDIRIGDMVDSYDEKTKRVVKQQVIKIWKNRPNSLVRVCFSDGRAFICTPNHPVLTQSGWCAAGMLTLTDKVLSYGSLGRSVSLLSDHSNTDRSKREECKEERLRFLQPKMFQPLLSSERSPFRRHTRASSLGRIMWLVPQKDNTFSSGDETFYLRRLRLLQHEMFGLRFWGAKQTEAFTALDGTVQLVLETDHTREGKSLCGQEEGLWVLRSKMCSARSESWDRNSQCYCDEEKRSHDLRSHAVEQSYAKPGNCREDEGQIERAHLLGSRGKWRTNETSIEVSQSAGVVVGNRINHQDFPGSRDVPIAAELLQSRYRSSEVEASNRSGWSNTQAEEVAVFGPSQRGNSFSLGVDSVEVLERGSDGTFGGLCSDGFVYNLEIEKTHTYFAEGVLVHNCHEYQNDDSAQGKSAHRLTGLGIPTILMTGTIMNGYAESLFSNMWAISPDFRREFSREQKQRFIDRYGYRKRIIEDRDGEGKVVEFGSMSDRVTRSERIIGDAPGVLPLFLLRHLLPLAVTLHKADLALDLPLCKQERHLIEPGPELKSRYEVLQRLLVERIKKDQFDPELAGKLFGQLAEIPSYLDRATADTGNTEEGVYEIRYPESVGAALVAAQEPFSASTLLPKEQWLLDMVEKELAEGRNVMVFTWHVNLLPRLSNLISNAIGQKVPILYANKVPTAKRQDWIDREIVNKDVKVMVTNPVAIQTGLNNLVHFATELWMENPACNPITYRQGIGRVDRIGQTIETRIYSPLYAGTLQVQLYDLLLKKVAVSVCTDGLDPESALLAAGIGEDEYLTGLSIGKQLWAMLSNGVVNEERGIVYKPARKSAPNDAVALLSMLEER
jgi:hypothetical protein